ncbi:uncharacterized protein LOC141914052 isoform X2 [Tubulanus polymorphus]|uniref:uncharacterized protein LOC141914052 isoform X2 n=1 Tax=Tubulanus polymorphus TaxID=672921 RepID=UPI003DA44CDE
MAAQINEDINETETGATEQGISYRELRDYIHRKLNDDGFVRLKNSFHDNLDARDRDECKNVFELLDILERQMVIDPEKNDYQELIINLNEIDRKAIADYISGQVNPAFNPTVDPAFVNGNNRVVSAESVPVHLASNNKTFHFCLLHDDEEVDGREDRTDRVADYIKELKSKLGDVKICTPDSFPEVGCIQGPRDMCVQKSYYRILYLDDKTWNSMHSKLTTEILYVKMIIEELFSVIPVVTTPELRREVRKEYPSLGALIKTSYEITDREHWNAMKSIFEVAKKQCQIREEDERLQEEMNELEDVALPEQAAAENSQTDEIDEGIASLELTD